MVYNLLQFCGTNEIVLGITSLTGIIGFILTIFVSIRTFKISKVLKHNEITSLYNREHMAFKNTFEGHRQSILKDSIKTDAILKDILQNVEEYHSKFDEIIHLRERFILWRFSRLLKKKATEVDFNDVCNYLAMLSGRLSKKEDKKHG